MGFAPCGDSAGTEESGGSGIGPTCASVLPVSGVLLKVLGKELTPDMGLLSSPSPLFPSFLFHTFTKQSHFCKMRVCRKE